MLKINIFPLVLISFYLTSCSSLTGPDKNGEPSVPAQEVSGTTFFELSHPDKLAIHFKSVDNAKEMSLPLDQEITRKVFDEGYWELVGFELNGKKFQAMNARKRFVLRVKKNQITYGGSFVVGCPNVGKDQNHLLKDMTFFDRYPFSSKNGLCELIVGNKLEKIQALLNTSSKINKLKIKEGF